MTDGKRSISRTELLEWADDSVAFIDLDLSRVSTVLLAQMYASEKNRVYDTYNLTMPIKVLEGIIGSDATRKEEAFRHEPLKGFYKKHFFSPRFLIKNIENYNKSKAGHENFCAAFDTYSQTEKPTVFDGRFAAYLSYHTTVTPYEEKHKNKCITGEWVVFFKDKISGLNYYLTLAFHQETNDEIYEKIKMARDFDKWSLIP